jgi:hypothetical protein
MPTPAPALPSFTDDFGSIPPKAKRLYAPAPDAVGGFRLSAAGRVVAAVRAQLAAEPYQEPKIARTSLKRDDWSIAVSAAEPGREREALLKAAATRQIEVRD